jgi:hypothetical protein
MQEHTLKSIAYTLAGVLQLEPVLAGHPPAKALPSSFTYAMW